MTKERFMQIAEEVGIASSDWKEDLWKTHIASLPANANYNPCEDTVRLALTLAGTLAGEALMLMLEQTIETEQ